jgi:hypothetical protein
LYQHFGKLALYVELRVRPAEVQLGPASEPQLQVQQSGIQRAASPGNLNLKRGCVHSILFNRRTSRSVQYSLTLSGAWQLEGLQLDLEATGLAASLPLKGAVMGPFQIGNGVTQHGIHVKDHAATTVSRAGRSTYKSKHSSASSSPPMEAPPAHSQHGRAQATQRPRQ